MSGVLGIIPARYGSVRFPGKPLALINGQPMIQHVYQRCLKAKMLDRLVVATDDKRIYDCVKGFNGQAVMTSSKHKSGSDRIAEVIKKPRFREFSIILNIQGDEPLIDPRAIDLLAKDMTENPKQTMATLATRFESISDIENPNTAKIVTDAKGRALYFSRCPIPFNRDGLVCLRVAAPAQASQAPPACQSLVRRTGKNYLKHIGMYAYRRNFLIKFTQWPEGRLERHEKLEQLRAVENGILIKVLYTRYNCLSVDFPGDIKKIERRIKKG